MPRTWICLSLLMMALGCDQGTNAKASKSDKESQTPSPQPSLTDDLKAMQGAWRVKKHLREGKPVEAEESFVGNTLLIKQQEMFYFDPYGRPRYTSPRLSFKFINTKKPPRKLKAIPPPLTPLEEKAGLVRTGFESIYEVSQDSLKFGYGGFFGNTPLSFQAMQGPKASGTLVEYERISPEEIYPQPKLDLDSREKAVAVLNQFGGEYSAEYLGEQPRPIRSVEISVWNKETARNPNEFCDAHLVLFEWVPEVQEVDLEKTSIRDEGLVHLSELKDLRDLSLDDTLVTGEGISVLAGLSGLESLDLSSCPLTWAGLREVAKLNQLKSLKLSSTEIADDWLEALASMESLEHLDLQDTAINGDGLQHLTKLPKLKKIFLPFDLPAKAKAKEVLPNVEF